MRTRTLMILPLALALCLAHVEIASTQSAPGKPVPQPRSFGMRVDVPLSALVVDDGDTVSIRWSASDIEDVRILGIDTPETRHVEHDIPYDQPFGQEARAFARGVFAGAAKVEILRANTTDPYGRTLAYVFVDGRNYSVMVVAARLAVESVTQFGDNGFPAEAAAVVTAAKAAGPLPFENPGAYRARMREVTRWLKSQGRYPPS